MELKLVSIVTLISLFIILPVCSYFCSKKTKQEYVHYKITGVVLGAHFAALIWALLNALVLIVYTCVMTILG